MADDALGLADLDARSREIFRRLVDTFLESGEPVGSRRLSQSIGLALSPASIRNVMADLTDLGLLYSPHSSAGRLPTEQGLRLFVDGFLEFGDVTLEERSRIEAQLAAGGRSFDEALVEASAMLSGLTQGAGLVMTPKRDAPLKHIEFVATAPSQALVVMVFEDGQVENRIVSTSAGLPSSALTEATNFLNARLRGRTLGEARSELARDIEAERNSLDALTAELIEQGLVAQSGEEENRTLIVRGRSNLLQDAAAAENLERVRLLFDDLENKKGIIQLLDAAEQGDGVRVFIGSENRLFSLSGSSVIVAPYRDADQKIVGALGVIGPTRLNYARVVPMVDYTAEVVSRLLK